MLEKMGDFFDARIEGYEAHQLDTIDDAAEFYPFTAGLLPREPGARVLDLGCGTGLELRYYFELAPAAHVTGIDLAPGMLEELRRKFPGKALTLILGSYFDVPFRIAAAAAFSKLCFMPPCFYKRPIHWYRRVGHDLATEKQW